MKKLLIVVMAFMFLVSCKKDQMLPLDSENQEVIDSRSASKVTICHIERNGSIHALSIDIDDLNAHLSHGDYVADNDQDGFTVLGACVGSADDCDDMDPDINPNMKEVCGDGIDNNCDGVVDEGCCYKPILNYPAVGATLDNGCRNQFNQIVWNFDWHNCSDATQYQLYVIHEGSPYPIVNSILTYSEYSHISTGYIINSNTTDWKWKVRAFIDGEWSDWSETRYFGVERLDTDCMQPESIEPQKTPFKYH